MKINIIDVGQVATHTAKNGRQYQSLEVTYKGENGQVSAKKLMSFSNPSVFNVAKAWEKGAEVNVVTEKDDAGYWQWTNVLKEGETPPAQVPSTAPSRVAPNTATRVTGSNYPTKDERANTQVYIVRQSSLTNAVSTLAMNKEGGGVEAEQVIALAEKYVDFVMNGKKESKPVASGNDSLDALKDLPI